MSRRTKPLLPLATLLVLSLTALRAQAPTEVQQIERALSVAPEHAGMWIELAAAHARAGNKAEAAKWLEKAVASGLDFELAGNPAYSALREGPEYKALLTRAEANRRVVDRSRVAFRLVEKDLVPEGIAHDPKTGAFFVGSLYKRKIVRVGKDGKATDFTAAGQGGLWDVLGMKVTPPPAPSGSAPAPAGGPASRTAGRVSSGSTSTRGSSSASTSCRASRSPICSTTWPSARGARCSSPTARPAWSTGCGPARPPSTLVAPGTFIYPNGIAISPDAKRLFVADFTKGISMVDVATGQVRPLPHPEKIHIAGVDGLYFQEGSLIAVQNGAGAARIVRFRLNAALDAVEAEEILESRNPLFVIPTTGTLAGGSFFYIANSQLRTLDDQGNLKPDARLVEPVVLEVPLARAAIP
ncbi:MAG TPA: hypothetical protein VEL74_04370 [Thermoanaerobaculia bacterium]|nr:hypothetical protein [Thermoanaerobaculia bacterium]